MQSDIFTPNHRLLLQMSQSFAALEHRVVSDARDASEEPNLHSHCRMWLVAPNTELGPPLPTKKQLILFITSQYKQVSV